MHHSWAANERHVSHTELNESLHGHCAHYLSTGHIGATGGESDDGGVSIAFKKRKGAAAEKNKAKFKRRTADRD